MVPSPFIAKVVDLFLVSSFSEKKKKKKKQGNSLSPAPVA